MIPLQRHVIVTVVFGGKQKQNLLINRIILKIIEIKFRPYSL